MPPHLFHALGREPAEHLGGLRLGSAFLSGPWRSLEAVEFATLKWVAWFNTQRLLEPIGNVPPAEAEARYYAEIAAPALAA